MKVPTRKLRIDAFHKQHMRRNALQPLPNFQICGWSSEESQKSRFEALLNSVDYTGGSVIDYGCGTGDLYAFLRSSDENISYIGLDQSADMVTLANNRYGPYFHQIGFDSVDFTAGEYVFASGIFQFQDPDNPLYYENLTKSLFAKCIKGMAVNFLSTMRSSSEMSSEELYVKPEDAATLASSLSGHWKIDHSYHPGRGDMTMGIIVAEEKIAWTRPR